MPSSFYCVYPQPSADAIDRYSQLGYAAHLLSQSPKAKDRPLQYVQQVIAPAIAHQQLRLLFDENGAPAAFIVWARLAPDVERRILTSSSIALNFSEWNEGSSLWLLDLIAPRGHLPYVLQHARDVLFKGEQRVRYLRQTRSGARAMEISRNTFSGCLRSMPAASVCRCGNTACVMNWPEYRDAQNEQ